MTECNVNDYSWRFFVDMAESNPSVFCRVSTPVLGEIDINIVCQTWEQADSIYNQVVFALKNNPPKTLPYSYVMRTDENQHPD